MKTRIVAAGDLAPAQTERMYAIFRTLYDGTSVADFLGDLANKTHVILLERDGTLVGFSTIRLSRAVIDGKPAEILFSGDTAIAREHWGSKALQATFTRFLVTWRLRHFATPCWWLLISKGYRTYLMMAHNVRHYGPREGRELDAHERAIALAGLGPRLARYWDDARGVLDFGTGACRVRDGVAPVEHGNASDPAVRFFRERHPGHVRGEELVCLGAIDWATIFGALWKYCLPRRWRRRALPADGVPANARV